MAWCAAVLFEEDHTWRTNERLRGQSWLAAALCIEIHVQFFQQCSTSPVATDEMDYAVWKLFLSPSSGLSDHSARFAEFVHFRYISHMYVRSCTARFHFLHNRSAAVTRQRGD